MQKSRILFLIVFAVCVLQAETFAQAQKRSVDLSAGKAAEAFKIPQSVWSNINNFVFLIGFDTQGEPGAVNVEYSKRFGQLKTYPALRAATRKWGQESFPLLQNFAKELAKGDVKTMLSELNAAFNKRKSDPVAAKREFDQKFATLNQKFTLLAGMSQRATEQFKQLDAASRAAILEYKSHNFPENQWIVIGPKLDDVQRAFGLMNGQWGALISDLKDLQKIVSNNQLDDIDIEVGLLTWDDIARSANGFVTDIPVQQRYLSGDNYYDNCPLLGSANNYFLVINSFLESKNYVLGMDGDKIKMMSRPAGRTTAAHMEWKFVKAGQGWWKIINRSKGDSFAVDSATHGSGYVPRLTPKGSYSGQLWRCMTTQASGWVRLINSFNGEYRSMDTYSDSFEAFMANTENRSGQYWRFMRSAAARPVQ
ncbi:MAG: hypothetical protein WBV94_19445 [Blastocatellia bacterium]